MSRKTRNRLIIAGVIALLGIVGWAASGGDSDPEPAAAPTASATASRPPTADDLDQTPEAAAFVAALRTQFPALADGRDDEHIGRDGVRVCEDILEQDEALALRRIPLRFERNGAQPDAAQAQAILALAKEKVCGPLGLLPTG